MSALTQRYVDVLEGDLQDLTRQEIKLLTKNFEDDVFNKGEFDKDTKLMIPKRDQWLLEMLAIISARSIFVGDWCTRLEDRLDEMENAG